jgi:tripartite-type tricarboxylate transporter receptor subunit TctC
VAMPYIQNGKLIPIAVDSEERSPILPDVPTLKELGLGGVDASTTWGISAPKGTPPEIINKLHDAIVEVLIRPDIKKRLEDLGVTVVASSPEEYGRRIDDDFQKWAKVIRENNITAN